MDPALKKRLIGASVLIVLAIIFLPMLFDGGEPAPGGGVQRMDIPVPPQRDFETRVVPLDPPAPSSSVAEAIGVPADDAVVLDEDLQSAAALTDEPVAAVTTPPESRVDAVSGEVVGSSAVPAATLPTVAPLVAEAPAATNTTPAASTPPASTPPVVAPAATTSAPAASAPAASAGGRFMVNIGSYANAANARQLENGLRAAGLAVRAEPVSVGGKPARRLRLGPYASRALAENARIRARTVRADLPASVIEIDDSPSTDAPVRSGVTARVAAFAVQVAVLSDVGKANAQRDTLRAAGFASFVEKLETANGTVHRVRIGPEADRANAEKIRGAIKQRFGYEAIIVEYP